MASARLKELYDKKIKLDLKENLSLENVMEVPKITKIVVNVGVKEAVADSKVMHIVKVVSNITGQELSTNVLARKSIARFKIRKVCLLV